MTRFDKVVAGLALAVWVAVAVGCSSRVRPGVGVSNDGTRVGLDLGQYDTAWSHPVTGAALAFEAPLPADFAALLRA